MKRLTLRPITLSDGTLLPSNQRLFVTNLYSDSKIYAHPEEFDPYRFLKKREIPGQSNAWQHVTVSPDHMGWGLGRHACPGRFFASTEIKIALAHLLMKFDWKFDEEDDAQGQKKPVHIIFETNSIINPAKKVLYRRRSEEVVLDLPEPMLCQSLMEDED
jgi:cytochrome P450